MAMSVGLLFFKTVAYPMNDRHVHSNGCSITLILMILICTIKLHY